MNRRILALVTSCLGAATLLAGGPLSAQPQVPDQPKVGLVCDGNANKTLTYKYGSAVLYATSGTAYASGDCPSYIVDIIVPSNKDGKVEDNIAIEAGPASAPNKASCESYSQTFSIRKTGADGKTSVVANETRKGKWSAGHCVISGLTYVLYRPAKGTEKYRVLTAATLNNKVAPVQVAVWFSTSGSLF